MIEFETKEMFVTAMGKNNEYAIAALTMEGLKKAFHRITGNESFFSLAKCHRVDVKQLAKAGELEESA